jgi:hypothetical protein
LYEAKPGQAAHLYRYEDRDELIAGEFAFTGDEEFFEGDDSDKTQVRETWVLMQVEKKKPWLTCSMCGGEGEVEVEITTDEGAHRETVTCTKCEGGGAIPGEWHVVGQSIPAAAIDRIILS